MNPTVLVATTDCWFPTARLAMALAHAGFQVEAVCPPANPMRHTRAPRCIHPYSGTRILSTFANAIEAANPALVIPGDDLAVRSLYALLVREEQRNRTGSALYRLIVRSLGAPESFPILFGRSEFMHAAQQEGVLCPPTRAIANRDELQAAIMDLGFPLVLKADGTSGGVGVKISHTLGEAERHFAQLQSPPSVLRAAKRTLLDRDSTLLRPALFGRNYTVNAQMLAAGHEATSALLCWEGEVLASLHFEVVQKAKASGHATVLRSIENRDMTFAANRMARRLHLSGFHGLDFMLDPATGHASLIEINPRCTQVGHLTLGAGQDLPAALYAAVTNTTAKSTSLPTTSDIITLFPQEWIRDAASPYLRSGHHDVPWQEPELLRQCVMSRRKQSRWYATPVAAEREERAIAGAEAKDLVRGQLP